MSNPKFDLLFDAATKVRVHSYSPYSQYAVAAAVEMEDGQIYSGTNVENSSYGSCVCAERIAIFKAVNEGKRQIKAVLVLTKNDPPAPPCGMCLQVISEFASANTLIYLANPEKKMVQKQLSDMLPMSFEGSNLKA